MGKRGARRLVPVSIVTCEAPEFCASAVVPAEARTTASAAETSRVVIVDPFIRRGRVRVWWAAFVSVQSKMASNRRDGGAFGHLEDDSSRLALSTEIGAL